QSVDVTEKVRALLAKGVTEIPANNDFAGSDPAVNTVKKLRIEYSANGQTHTETVDENQTLELPRAAHVTKALYGDLPSATGAEKKIDLTKKLSWLVENGALSVQIDNDFAGGDPLFGEPKECTVDYSLDGVRKSMTVAENETLVIGTQGTFGEPPPLTLHADANGKMTVSATTPGAMQITLASGKKMRAEIRDVP